MSPSPTERPSSFPQWVALGSLGLVLWLFFANTAPAMREHQELGDLHTALLKMRQDYDQALAEARLGSGAHAERDVQGLLVAIDQRGYTPAELCAEFPLPADAGDRTSKPHGSGTRRTGRTN